MEVQATAADQLRRNVLRHGGEEHPEDLLVLRPPRCIRRVCHSGGGITRPLGDGCGRGSDGAVEVAMERSTGEMRHGEGSPQREVAAIQTHTKAGAVDGIGAVAAGDVTTGPMMANCIAAEQEPEAIDRRLASSDGGARSRERRRCDGTRGSVTKFGLGLREAQPPHISYIYRTNNTEL